MSTQDRQVIKKLQHELTGNKTKLDKPNETESLKVKDKKTPEKKTPEKENTLKKDKEVMEEKPVELKPEPEVKVQTPEPVAEEKVEKTEAVQEDKIMCSPISLTKPKRRHKPTPEYESFQK